MMTAHGINWFTFHNAAYKVETVDVCADALAAGDIVVELTRTNHSFAKATVTGSMFICWVKF